MSFYQNVFDQEFRQSWPIGDDKQFALTFVCPPNKNGSELQISWNLEPYNLSSATDLTIYYAFDKDFKNWAPLTIDVSGATASATKASEVIDALNDDATFSDYFTASLDNYQRGTREAIYRVFIKAKKPKHSFKFYIDNSGAETKLKFNKYAGVADMPTYMDRHTIANRFTYPVSAGSTGMLIRLGRQISGNTVANPTVVTSEAHGLTTGDVVYFVNSNSTPALAGQYTVTVTGVDTFTVPVNVTTAGTRGEWFNATEYGIITDYGLDYTVMKKDWEHLGGKTGTFTFQKITVDGSDRITQIIEYNTGAVAGDFGKKINYSYTGANLKPDQITETPYQLVSGDLLTP